MITYDVQQSAYVLKDERIASGDGPKNRFMWSVALRYVSQARLAVLGLCHTYNVEVRDRLHDMIKVSDVENSLVWFFLCPWLRLEHAGTLS